MTVVEDREDEVLHPLEDPSYDPVHKPVDGRVPDVVLKWGKASQLRWFQRFWKPWTPLKFDRWNEVWCSSEYHKGACCGSCYGEYEDGYAGGGVMMDGWC